MSRAVGRLPSGAKKEKLALAGFSFFIFASWESNRSSPKANTFNNIPCDAALCSVRVRALSSSEEERTGCARKRAPRPGTLNLEIIDMGRIEN
jgi:hypothetical protein